MLNPEDCRAQARNYQRLAVQVTGGASKDHYVALAKRWERLAADLERAIGFIDTVQAVRRKSTRAA